MESWYNDPEMYLSEVFSDAYHDRLDATVDFFMYWFFRVSLYNPNGDDVIDAEVNTLGKMILYFVIRMRIVSDNLQF